MGLRFLPSSIVVNRLLLCILNCTSFRQGVIEDALYGLTVAPVTPADTAAVLPHIRAQDPVTAHVLQGDRQGTQVRGSRQKENRGIQTQPLVSIERIAHGT